MIGGRSTAVFRSPQNSQLSHLNILGPDFCNTNDVIKVENYVNRRVQLFFSALDNQDPVFEFCDQRGDEKKNPLFLFDFIMFFQCLVGVSGTVIVD